MEDIDVHLPGSKTGIKVRKLSCCQSFFRKLLILFVIPLFSNPLSLLILGVLNRLFFFPVKSIFICYPASSSYTEKYGFRFLLPFFKYYPVIVGCFFQGGRIGVICAISSLEADFQSPDFFLNFTRRANLMKKLLGVSSMNYSGILPSAMKKALFLSEEELQTRSELVGQVVVHAEHLVRDVLKLSPSVPLILLGGKGSVGKNAVKIFLSQGREIFIVDQGDRFPLELFNREAILIDVARKGVLESYVDSFWKGMVIINETYPEPSKEVIDLLNEKNIPLFHIAGVKALAVPRFPHAYAGGVPCCAMNPSKKVRPLVKSLN